MRGAVATPLHPSVPIPIVQGADPEHPYPLRRLFLRAVLPGLLLYAATITGVVMFGARAAIEDVYVDGAAKDAAALEKAIAGAAPQGWRNLLAAPSATS